MLPLISSDQVQIVRRSAELARVLFRRRLELTPRTFNADRHLEAALRWLLVAREHSTDGGLPAYYDVLRGSWRQSYPETTGYTIPTLLACADCLQWPDLRQVAIALADYLLTTRTAEGGVAHWDRSTGQRADPIVFDTGQVIFGWLAAWRQTMSARYLEAALKAADWLVSIQAADGAWASYQHLDVVKVIDTRVALALVELGCATSRGAYLAAARRNLDWALQQQQPNGWFRRASFREGQDPFTHTLAYAAEGLMECGLRLDAREYVVAGITMAEALLEQQRTDGWLASTYGPDWRPTSRSTCLTGNCQMALLWLRCYERTGQERFRRAADLAIRYVASTQDLETSNRRLLGAIGGSYPIFGLYERMKYPNWAAKFFIDALLAGRGLEGARAPRSAPITR